jgi:hypothetical protein
MKHIIQGKKDKKMRRVNGIISLLSMVLLAICSQCELAMDYSYGIDLVNNSGHSIGYYFADGGKYGTFYPDSLPETNDYIMYDINKVVRPGFEQHYKSWEKFFQNLPYDTLSVFIFHTDTLNKYTWGEVRSGYMILKRYDLSLEDLREMEFKIIYP